MGRKEFFSAIQKGITLLHEAGSKVTLVHHSDADGLASAAIMKVALIRAGFSVRCLCLERLLPQILVRIHTQFHSTIIYLDLGGEGAPMISEANRGQHLTLIIDHHHPEEVSDPQVLNITTEFYGLSGEMDISAATAAYMFAQVLDKKNRDLAYLGVIGALGDSHNRDGRLVGENRRALNDAVEQRHVCIEKSNGYEHYILTRFGKNVSMSFFAKSLTTLAAAGYYIGGPALGIHMCFEGISPKVQSTLDECNRLKQAAFEKVLKKIQRTGLQKANYIQWLKVGENFAPMGVTMIGEFCSLLRTADFIDPDKYIVGFQTMDQKIPGLGSFDWSLSKASMRFPALLGRKIVIDRQMPGLAYLVPEATREVGGIVDACHNYAAATVISKGNEEKFIAVMDKLVELCSTR